MHIKEIKGLLIKEKMKTSKRMLISKYFLRKVTWIMLRNMENLEELLKRF
jgi:hypothetical protein